MNLLYAFGIAGCLWIFLAIGLAWGLARWFRWLRDGSG